MYCTVMVAKPSFSYSTMLEWYRPRMYLPGQTSGDVFSVPCVVIKHCVLARSSTVAMTQVHSRSNLTFLKKCPNVLFCPVYIKIRPTVWSVSCFNYTLKKITKTYPWATRGLDIHQEQAYLFPHNTNTFALPCLEGTGHLVQHTYTQSLSNWLTILVINKLDQTMLTTRNGARR